MLVAIKSPTATPTTQAKIGCAGQAQFARLPPMPNHAPSQGKTQNFRRRRSVPLIGSNPLRSPHAASLEIVLTLTP